MCCVVLHEFLNLVSSLGKKVKILRSDQGTEFGSHTTENKITALLRSKGITKLVSTPYCPQQNGYIERANQTVINLARSMIQQLKLGEKLWAETTNTAVYLFNKIGTQNNNWTTAFELFQDLVREVAVGGVVSILSTFFLFLLCSSDGATCLLPF